MKTDILKPQFNTNAGLLLTVLPLFMLFASIMYEPDTTQSYHLPEPLEESVGISQSFGWNIKLLILFWPA